MITGPCTRGTGGSTGTLTVRSSGPRSGCCAPPGHAAHDISTVASAPDDVFACTHAWWAAGGPADDPLGSDAGAPHVSPDLLLSFATVIVPVTEPPSARTTARHASPPRLARL
jgi:hypothetical protein